MVSFTVVRDSVFVSWPYLSLRFVADHSVRGGSRKKSRDAIIKVNDMDATAGPELPVRLVRLWPDQFLSQLR